MEGKQLSGHRKRTSEVMLHLAIMKSRPEVKAVVHCHPPHATAFGVAREPVPQCVLPEVEIFLGDVPITKYCIPGGKEFADTILPFVHKSNVIILANHGTVSYGETVEKAYWWTEILDAYCRILMLSRGLGQINYFSEPEAKALLDLKEKWGYKDPRNEMKNCDICANDVFRSSWKETGLQPKAFQPPQFAGNTSSDGSTPANGSASPTIAKAPASTPDQEALIQAITDRVMAMLNSKQ
jgi:L-fuculose-phosphate aldolase